MRTDKLHHVTHAHIFMDMARAAASLASEYAISDPVRAMYLDSAYRDFLGMAKNHLQISIKIRKEMEK